MPQGAHALDARLNLLRQAEHSLDLQVYLLADDEVGRNVLRELRDAAARGVRVRLLLDDFYTTDTEKYLLGLQTYPNVEIRLFNPFSTGRQNPLGRGLNLMGEFSRLNRRMHNKLLVADKALAIAGGRNLANEYFGKNSDYNFIDTDLLVAGALVTQLTDIFERYWNSDHVIPIQLFHHESDTFSQERSAVDERLSNPTLTPVFEPVQEPDLYGQPPLSHALVQGQHRFIHAQATAIADPPEKARGLGEAEGVAFSSTLTANYIETLRRARQEIFIYTPYFIPGKKGVERLHESRLKGVDIKVVTNAMSTSDEPLVSMAYSHYRPDLLRIGVQLFELSSARTSRDSLINKAFRRSKARLHAKMAFLDRRIVLIGSMNMDFRSAFQNTEMGIGIDSPELARMLMETYRADHFPGAYKVSFNGQSGSLYWTGEGDEDGTVHPSEPEVGVLQKLKLWLQMLLVPEELL